MFAAPALRRRAVYPSSWSTDEEARADPNLAGQARVKIDMLEKELLPAARRASAASVLRRAGAQGRGRQRRLSRRRAGAAGRARHGKPTPTSSGSPTSASAVHRPRPLRDHEGPRADNDLSIEALGRMAARTRRRAQVVAPSAMMDGQVAAIRRAPTPAQNTSSELLDEVRLRALRPLPRGRQLGPRWRPPRLPGAVHDVNQAIRESLLDEAEGADMLMVKPAMFYLT